MAEGPPRTPPRTPPVGEEVLYKRESKLGMTTFTFRSKRYTFPSVIVKSDLSEDSVCVMLDVGLFCPFCTGSSHKGKVPGMKARQMIGSQAHVHRQRAAERAAASNVQHTQSSHDSVHHHTSSHSHAHHAHSPSHRTTTSSQEYVTTHTTSNVPHNKNTTTGTQGKKSPVPPPIPPRRRLKKYNFEESVHNQPEQTTRTDTIDSIESLPECDRLVDPQSMQSRGPCDKSGHAQVKVQKHVREGVTCEQQETSFTLHGENAKGFNKRMKDLESSPLMSKKHTPSDSNIPTKRAKSSAFKIKRDSFEKQSSVESDDSKKSDSPKTVTIENPDEVETSIKSVRELIQQFSAPPPRFQKTSSTEDEEVMDVKDTELEELIQLVANADKQKSTESTEISVEQSPDEVVVESKESVLENPNVSITRLDHVKPGLIQIKIDPQDRASRSSSLNLNNSETSINNMSDVDNIFLSDYTEDEVTDDMRCETAEDTDDTSSITHEKIYTLPSDQVVPTTTYNLSTIATNVHYSPNDTDEQSPHEVEDVKLEDIIAKLKGESHQSDAIDDPDIVNIKVEEPNDNVVTETDNSVDKSLLALPKAPFPKPKSADDIYEEAMGILEADSRVTDLEVPTRKRSSSPEDEMERILDNLQTDTFSDFVTLPRIFSVKNEKKSKDKKKKKSSKHKVEPMSPKEIRPEYECSKPVVIEPVTESNIKISKAEKAERIEFKPVPKTTERIVETNEMYKTEISETRRTITETNKTVNIKYKQEPVQTETVLTETIETVQNPPNETLEEIQDTDTVDSDSVEIVEIVDLQSRFKESRDVYSTEDELDDTVNAADVPRVPSPEEIFDTVMEGMGETDEGFTTDWTSDYGSEIKDQNKLSQSPPKHETVTPEGLPTEMYNIYQEYMDSNQLEVAIDSRGGHTSSVECLVEDSEGRSPPQSSLHDDASSYAHSMDDYVTSSCGSSTDNLLLSCDDESNVPFKQIIGETKELTRNIMATFDKIEIDTDEQSENDLNKEEEFKRDILDRMDDQLDAEYYVAHSEREIYQNVINELKHKHTSKIPDDNQEDSEKVVFDLNKQPQYSEVYDSEIIVEEHEQHTEELMHYQDSMYSPKSPEVQKSPNMARIYRIPLADDKTTTAHEFSGDESLDEFERLEAEMVSTDGSLDARSLRRLKAEAAKMAESNVPELQKQESGEWSTDIDAIVNENLESYTEEVLNSSGAFEDDDEHELHDQFIEQQPGLRRITIDNVDQYNTDNIDHVNQVTLREMIEDHKQRQDLRRERSVSSGSDGSTVSEIDEFIPETEEHNAPPEVLEQAYQAAMQVAKLFEEHTISHPCVHEHDVADDIMFEQEDEEGKKLSMSREQAEEFLSQLMASGHKEHKQKRKELTTCLKEVAKQEPQEGDVVKEEITTQEVTVLFAWPKSIGKQLIPRKMNEGEPFREIHVRRVMKVSDKDIQMLEGPTIEDVQQEHKEEDKGIVPVLGTLERKKKAAAPKQFNNITANVDFRVTTTTLGDEPKTISLAQRAEYSENEIADAMETEILETVNATTAFVQKSVKRELDASVAEAKALDGDIQMAITGPSDSNDKLNDNDIPDDNSDDVFNDIVDNVSDDILDTDDMLGSTDDDLGSTDDMLDSGSDADVSESDISVGRKSEDILEPDHCKLDSISDILEDMQVNENAPEGDFQVITNAGGDTTEQSKRRRPDLHVLLPREPSPTPEEDDDSKRVFYRILHSDGREQVKKVKVPEQENGSANRLTVRTPAAKSASIESQPFRLEETNKTTTPVEKPIVKKPIEKPVEKPVEKTKSKSKKRKGSSKKQKSSSDLDLSESSDSSSSTDDENITNSQQGSLLPLWKKEEMCVSDIENSALTSDNEVFIDSTPDVGPKYASLPAHYQKPEQRNAPHYASLPAHYKRIELTEAQPLEKSSDFLQIKNEPIIEVEAPMLIRDDTFDDDPMDSDFPREPSPEEIFETVVEGMDDVDEGFTARGKMGSSVTEVIVQENNTDLKTSNKLGRNVTEVVIQEDYSGEIVNEASTLSDRQHQFKEIFDQTADLVSDDDYQIQNNELETHADEVYYERLEAYDESIQSRDQMLDYINCYANDLSMEIIAASFWEIVELANPGLKQIKDAPEGKVYPGYSNTLPRASKLKVRARQNEDIMSKSLNTSSSMLGAIHPLSTKSRSEECQISKRLSLSNSMMENIEIELRNATSSDQITSIIDKCAVEMERTMRVLSGDTVLPQIELRKIEMSSSDAILSSAIENITLNLHLPEARSKKASRSISAEFKFRMSSSDDYLTIPVKKGKSISADTLNVSDHDPDELGSPLIRKSRKCENIEKIERDIMNSLQDFQNALKKKGNVQHKQKDKQEYHAPETQNTTAATLNCNESVESEKLYVQKQDQSVETVVQQHAKVANNSVDRSIGTEHNDESDVDAEICLITNHISMKDGERTAGNDQEFSRRQISPSNKPPETSKDSPDVEELLSEAFDGCIQRPADSQPEEPGIAAEIILQANDTPTSDIDELDNVDSLDETMIIQKSTEYLVESDPTKSNQSETNRSQDAIKIEREPSPEDIFETVVEGMGGVDDNFAPFSSMDKSDIDNNDATTTSISTTNSSQQVSVKNYQISETEKILSLSSAKEEIVEVDTLDESLIIQASSEYLLGGSSKTERQRYIGNESEDMSDKVDDSSKGRPSEELIAKDLEESNRVKEMEDMITISHDDNTEAIDDLDEYDIIQASCEYLVESDSVKDDSEPPVKPKSGKSKSKSAKRKTSRVKFDVPENVQSGEILSAPVLTCVLIEESRSCRNVGATQVYGADDANYMLCGTIEEAVHHACVSVEYCTHTEMSYAFVTPPLAVSNDAFMFRHGEVLSVIADVPETRLSLHEKGGFRGCSLQSLTTMHDGSISNTLSTTTTVDAIPNITLSKTYPEISMSSSYLNETRHRLKYQNPWFDSLVPSPPQVRTDALQRAGMQSQFSLSSQESVDTVVYQGAIVQKEQSLSSGIDPKYENDYPVGDELTSDTITRSEPIDMPPSDNHYLKIVEAADLKSRHSRESTPSSNLSMCSIEQADQDEINDLIEQLSFLYATETKTEVLKTPEYIPQADHELAKRLADDDYIDLECEVASNRLCLKQNYDVIIDTMDEKKSSRRLEKQAALYESDFVRSDFSPVEELCQVIDIDDGVDEADDIDIVTEDITTLSFDNDERIGNAYCIDDVHYCEIRDSSVHTTPCNTSLNIAVDTLLFATEHYTSNKFSLGNINIMNEYYLTFSFIPDSCDTDYSSLEYEAFCSNVSSDFVIAEKYNESHFATQNTLAFVNDHVNNLKEHDPTIDPQIFISIESSPLVNIASIDEVVCSEDVITSFHRSESLCFGSIDQDGVPLSARTQSLKSIPDTQSDSHTLESCVHCYPETVEHFALASSHNTSRTTVYSAVAHSESESMLDQHLNKKSPISTDFSKSMSTSMPILTAGNIQAPPALTSNQQGTLQNTPHDSVSPSSDKTASSVSVSSKIGHIASVRRTESSDSLKRQVLMRPRVSLSAYSTDDELMQYFASEIKLGDRHIDPSIHLPESSTEGFSGYTSDTSNITSLTENSVDRVDAYDDPLSESEKNQIKSVSDMLQMANDSSSDSDGPHTLKSRLQRLPTSSSPEFDKLMVPSNSAFKYTRDSSFVHKSLRDLELKAEHVPKVGGNILFAPNRFATARRMSLDIMDNILQQIRLVSREFIVQRPSSWSPKEHEDRMAYLQSVAPSESGYEIIEPKAKRPRRRLRSIEGDSSDDTDASGYTETDATRSRTSSESVTPAYVSPVHPEYTRGKHIDAMRKYSSGYKCHRSFSAPMIVPVERTNVHTSVSASTGEIDHRRERRRLYSRRWSDYRTSISMENLEHETDDNLDSEIASINFGRRQTESPNMSNDKNISCVSHLPPSAPKRNKLRFKSKR